MEYMDEELLKAKRQLQEQEKKSMSEETLERELKESIFDGKIHIFEREVVFARRIISELGISIYMPEEFFKLDDETRKIIYPMDRAPSYVYCSDKINFQIAFNYTENNVPNDGIARFMIIAKKLIENMGPKVRILGTAVIEKDGKNIGIMEFLSKAIDMTMYNVMFYFSLEERLMIGTINFPSEYKKRLVKVAKEIIDSLKIEE